MRSATLRLVPATPAPRVNEPRPVRWLDRLQALPWEKALTWAVFLLLVWILRDLFLVIFLTFVASYLLRISAVWILRRFGRWPEPPAWLERTVAVACFAVMVTALYGAGRFVGPRLVAQGEALVERVSRVQPQQEFDDILAKSVGAYLFANEYGQPGDERYERAFRQFREEGLRLQAYQDFPALEAAIEGPFIADRVTQERRRLHDELGQGGAVDRELRRWFLEEKAPALFARDRRQLVAQWETRYREAARFDPKTPPLASVKREPGFQARRDQQILDRLFEATFQDPETRAALVEEWADAVAGRLSASLHEQPIEQQPGFAAYYQDRRRLDPAAIPYAYDAYLRLKQAYEQGDAAFARTLALLAPQRSEAQARMEFQASVQRTLARRWSTGALAAQLRQLLGRYLESQAATAGLWVRDKIGLLLSLPFQVGLSLVLSLLITWDVPRLRRGLRKLESSRLQHAYREIAPSLVSFGHLMGRSFQAQGVIALLNSLLTFVAIQFLHIQSEVVLCSIVFVCSFIPVVGVILSSVPIAIMALVQPGGSLVLAMQAILAIVVIHLLETMLFNPKIVGDMLHLHPVLVLAVLAIGEHFFGVWGLLLAVPVTVYLLRHVILGEPVPGVAPRQPLPAPATAGVLADATPAGRDDGDAA